jgi:alanyl-tRNA synthetase
MEYYRDEQGVLTKLTKQNVDTGMGFERMYSVLQQKETIFETDLFLPAIQVIEKTTQLTYVDNQKRCRIIVDHARTSFMLINDGLLPSNIGA